MEAPHSCCIRFSGLTVRFLFPTPVQLSAAFQDLRCKDVELVDEEIEIRLLSEPICLDVPVYHVQNGIQIYKTEGGWLRIHTPLTAEDGCQVAFFLCPNHKNILYYPASRWEFFSHPLHCMHLIAGELLLLRHEAFLLHSSAVLHQGKVILFSGPPCAGKSTQADLWKKHLGAEILNGDRSVIMKKEDGFYGGGSPWCGTSGIYRPEQAPIAGIFLVNKTPVNQVRRLGREAFAPLFSQTTINSWDTEFMDRVTALYQEMLCSVPVYRLDCRPDEEAVQVVYRTVFERRPEHGC